MHHGGKSEEKGRPGRCSVLAILSGGAVLSGSAVFAVCAVFTGGAVFSGVTLIPFVAFLAGRLHAERNPGLTFIIGNLPLARFGIDTKP